MRRVQILFWLAFAIFSSFHAPLAAQTCPDPQNLSIVIDNSSPPVANVSWSVPPRQWRHRVHFSLFYQRRRASNG